MFRNSIAACLAIALALCVVVRADDDKDDKKPKYTTKQVMAKAMKGKLWQKVASGKASKEEQASLVEMFEALAKNKPKKGDEKSWKEKTSALVEAAKGVQAGTKGADAKLKKAANCASCHKAHK